MILEELQHSKVIESKIIEDIKKIYDQFKTDPSYNVTVAKSKRVYLDKFKKEYIFDISDIIYKKFPIVLGACLTQKSSEVQSGLIAKEQKEVKEALFQKTSSSGTLFKKKIPGSDSEKKGFLADLNKKADQKKAEKEDFIKKINDAVSKKSIEDLPLKIDDCKIKLVLEPFYDKGSDGFITMGSLGQNKGYIKEKGVINTYTISLNLSEASVDRITTEDKTIRHELQHLTQNVNNFCLEVGEQYLKGKFQWSSNFFEECYNKANSSRKVGSGKTKTQLRQNDEVGNFDPETGKKTNISKAYSKVFNDDAISSEEEKKIAKRLQYLGDDKEYKNWLYDKVSDILDLWKDVNKKDLELYRKKFLLKKRFASILNESLTDEQTKKMELRKVINSMAKEFNLSYQVLYRDIKNFSSEDFLNVLVKFVMKDEDISVIAKLRKETTKDITNLLRKKLEELLNSDL